MHNAAEDYILVVEEGQRGTSCNIELTLIGMLLTVSFAHAEHADIFMLDLERFIFEFPTVQVAALLWILGWFYSSTLDVHSFDDSEDFSALIGELFAICSSMTFAKCEEVVAGAWSDVMEQLEDNGLVTSLEVDLHGGVLSGLRLVDQLLEAILGLLLVDHHV